jgi:hypothetical protein
VFVLAAVFWMTVGPDMDLEQWDTGALSPVHFVSGDTPGAVVGVGPV